jgi:hypothetical protein
VNGNADGTHGISSATVKVNGTQILGLSDFGQNVAVIDRTVTMQPSNTLEVRLTTAPALALPPEQERQPAISATLARHKRTEHIEPKWEHFTAP